MESEELAYEDKREDEEIIDEEDEEGWSDDNKWGASKRQTSSKKGSRPIKKKTIPSSRLYAIARGRGGQRTTGLYREEWDLLEYLVSGYPNGRFKKVKSKAEGVAFIKKCFNAKKIPKP